MSVLWRLIGYLRHQKRLVGLVLILLVIGSFMRTVPPTLTKFAIDDGILGNDMRVLIGTVGAFAGAVLLTNLLMAGRLFGARWSSQKAIHDIRNDLYMHLGSKSMSFFDRHFTGDLMSRVTNDVNLIQVFFNMAGTVVLSAVALLAFNLAFMFALEWTMTLALLGLFPVLAALQRWARTIVPLFRAANQQLGVLNSKIREAVAGIKVIQAFGREDYHDELFDRENRKLRTIRFRLLARIAAYFQGVELLAGLATLLILGMGSWKVIEGDFTLGGLVAFQSYLLLILTPLRFLGFAVQMGQQAMTSGERVFQIIDTPLEVTEAPNAIELPPGGGSIEFDRVSFQYGEEHPILREVSLDVPAGTTLALVGASGSGKSSLVNLLPRFYDPTAGSIRVDGVDLRDLTLRSLRSEIGMVMQETFLFNMSVGDNIKFGRPEASLAEVEEAARTAEAHEFIQDLPDGYDTRVGDRGVRLSGGQRQRVAIARALLVQPRILILDEATSSVDTQTERRIRDALASLMSDRTSIVIAHRLATVEHAHRIAVIEGGAVAARGTHVELLATSESYRRIHDLQFRDEDEARRIVSPSGEVVT